MLPARAGEVLRPWLLARKEGLSATAAFATIILERVLDTVMVLLLFGLFLLLAEPDFARGDPPGLQPAQAWRRVWRRSRRSSRWRSCSSWRAIPATLNSAPGVFERVLPARLAAIGTRFLRTFANGLAIVRQPGRLAVALLLSVPLWLSIATGIWCVSRAFHIDLPFMGSFLVMALLVVGVAVPTPGAVGGFHYFYRLAATAFYRRPERPRGRCGDRATCGILRAGGCWSG